MSRLEPSRSLSPGLQRVHRKRGFTLIEVLAALIIVGLGMLGVIQAVIQAANNGTYLREKTLAHWIAMNLVTERRLMTAPPESVRARTQSSSPDSDGAGRSRSRRRRSRPCIASTSESVSPMHPRAPRLQPRSASMAPRSRLPACRTCFGTGGAARAVLRLAIRRETINRPASRTDEPPDEGEQ